MKEHIDILSRVINLINKYWNTVTGFILDRSCVKAKLLKWENEKREASYKKFFETEKINSSTLKNLIDSLKLRIDEHKESEKAAKARTAKVQAINKQWKEITLAIIRGTDSALNDRDKLLEDLHKNLLWCFERLNRYFILENVIRLGFINNNNKIDEDFFTTVYKSVMLEIPNDTVSKLADNFRSEYKKLEDKK